MEILRSDIQKLIEQRSWGKLRERLAVWEIPEIAHILQELDKADRVLLFRTLPRHLSADVFSYFEPEEQDGLLRELTDQETRHILENMGPDDRTALLEELPARITTKLLSLLGPEDLKEARQLLGYPEESVGRLMTPDYVDIRPDWTIAKALDHVRAIGKDSETINRIFITDDSGKLLDDIMLRHLILANPGGRVDSLMNHQFIALSAFDDRERAVELLQEYDLTALPVVDSDGFLIGIVTFDDVWDVAEEEVTEDIQKQASVSPLKMSYHRASVWNLYTKRIGWLAALVLLSLISSSVIAAFEEKLASAIMLAAFIPLLLGSAGNTGSQSATLAIRALVTGDIDLSDWREALLKEIGVGLLLGMTLGSLGWILGSVFGVRGGTGIQIGTVVGVSMLTVTIITNLVGLILPFILEKVKLDPAVASSPLITTIADATGLLVYFSVASWVLQV